MSLFPAYTETPGVSENKKESEWQNNSSYQNTNAVICAAQNVRLDNSAKSSLTLSSSDKESDDKDKTRSPKRNSPKRKSKKQHKHRKKGKKEKKRIEEVVETRIEVDNENFFIDVSRQIGFLSVKTLLRRAKPRYFINFKKGLSPVLYYKNDKLKLKERYFSWSRAKEPDKAEGSLEHEVTVSKTVEQFNKSITQEPHNIQLWITYVHFQDDFYKYQHIQHKSVAERERAAAQQKLAILERAMTTNPGNEELQQIWFQIAMNVLPTEEAVQRIESFISLSGANTTLWLSLVSLTQQSLSRCSVSAVSAVYQRALTAVQRYRSRDDVSGDGDVIELLLHLTKFLEQAGLWESVWTLMKLHLSLNLDLDLAWTSGVLDEVVKSREDAALTSSLPLWHTWLRVETTREASHFAPVPESQDFPQRVVDSADMAPLVHHLHRAHQFSLILVMVSALKVPFLPLTEGFVKFLTPHALPWTLDGVETLLSSNFTSPALQLNSSHLKHACSLSSNPQYLSRGLGQSELLEHISKAFQCGLAALEGRQRSSLGIWWLRFQRWLYKLERVGLASLPEGIQPIKHVFKEFLKLEENRNNILYFREFSLAEYEQGNMKSAVSTIKTVIRTRPPVLSLADSQDQGELCSLHRSLVEQLIGSGEKDAAVDALKYLSTGVQEADAEKKFHHLSVELIHEFSSDADIFVADLLLPVFVVEWIGCYMWFMALVRTPETIVDYFKTVDKGLRRHKGIYAEHVRESLWEVYATILWTLDRNNQKVITQVLQEAFTQFPRNLTLLAMMSTKELEGSGMWLTMSKTFCTPPTPLGALMLACTALERFQKCLPENQSSLATRVRLLLQRLTREGGRNSATLHKMYLRFLRTWNVQLLESAHVYAVESCPWNKSIYMEGISLLPDKLMQFTDVMIEKELRIHVTPDELEELRD